MAQNNELVDNISRLPGFSLWRSLLFVIYVAMLIIGILHIPSQFPSFFRVLTTVIAVLIMIMIGFSCKAGIMIQGAEIATVKNGREFFIPKILIDLSIIGFIGIVCLWVIILGGLLTSPFGDLLVVTPLYATWQLFNKRDENNYRKILSKWDSMRTTTKPTNNEVKMERYFNILKILKIVPLFFLIVTVTIFEYLVRKWQLHQKFIGNIDLQKTILSSDWYLLISYSVFFVAALSIIIPAHQNLKRINNKENGS